MENSNKKNNLTWLWITIAIIAVAAIAVWCAISASSADGAASTFKFTTTLVMFTIVFLALGLGYLLGGVNIKGVSNKVLTLMEAERYRVARTYFIIDEICKLNLKSKE